MLLSRIQLLLGFAGLATILNSFSAAAEILECYQCYEEAHMFGRRPFCKHLKDTAEYKVQCPNSTMCLKVVHTINLLHGKTRTTETRGCASQVKIIQVLRNGKYVDVPIIDEPYQEECIERNTHNMLTANVMECYCRGNLCNSSKEFNLSGVIKFVVLLLSSLRIITAI